MNLPARAIAIALVLMAALVQSLDVAAATGLTAFQLKPAEIPVSLREESLEVVQAIRWKDKAGDNMVVLSQSGEKWIRDGSRTAALRAKHFLKPDRGEWTKTWQLADAVDDCQVDVSCAFLKNSLSLSDVDSDGIAEVSFVYRADCFGGIDPIVQKLMIFHNGTKYAIRGRTVFYDADGRPADSEHFLFDEAFKKAPPGLLRHALQKWRHFQNHNMPSLGRP